MTTRTNEEFAYLGGKHTAESGGERETRTERGLWRGGNPYPDEPLRSAWFRGYDANRQPESAE